MEKAIVFERAKFWTIKNILFCDLFNDDINVVLEIKTLKKYIKAITSLCKGQSMPFLIDARNVKGTYVVSVAKLLASSPELQKIRMAEVFVVNSLNIKLLINSYKRIYNPSTPYKIYSNYDEALGYCEELKREKFGSN